MLNKLLIPGFLILAAVGILLVVFPEGSTGTILVLALGILVAGIFRHTVSDDKDFITAVFVSALFVRIGFGVLVHVLEIREFFGGDAFTYDLGGARLVDMWYGNQVASDDFTRRAAMTTGSGWGMNYFVGAIYFVLGRNIFAAQSICGLIGASTAPMVYICARKIFENIRVARFSAIAIAIFPSFIIWSAQLMKDGLIIFLLVVAMTMVLQIQARFNYLSLLILVLSLFGIMSLRFYIFYMVLAAVAGSFLIGTSASLKSIAGRTVAIIVVGLGLTYMGVIRNATVDLGNFGNLEAVQRSRYDLSRSANSGFGASEDVSTPEGAIAALPFGLTYLMLAPFPWQMSNLRQLITLPEVLTWWAILPLFISGFWFSLKHKLRRALPILIFTVILTITYSIFQGNVGTAYRQRTQIQVFMFMFIAVGWALKREKAENRRMLNLVRKKRLEAAYRQRGELGPVN